MCGRYELHTHPAAQALVFGLKFPPEITPRYNIAPTQLVPIVRLRDGGRELSQVSGVPWIHPGQRRRSSTPMRMTSLLIGREVEMRDHCGAIIQAAAVSKSEPASANAE